MDRKTGMELVESEVIEGMRLCCLKNFLWAPIKMAIYGLRVRRD